MVSYKRRIADDVLERRLRNKGAILMEGPKWCGKTTTCEQHAGSILYMTDPDRMRQNLQLADISPRSLLQGEAPRLVDALRTQPYSQGATIIGEITADRPGWVVMRTEIGAETLLPQPGGELLPRIC